MMLINTDGREIDWSPQNANYPHWLRLADSDECQAISSIMWGILSTMESLSFAAMDVVARDTTGIIDAILNDVFKSQRSDAECFAALFLWGELRDDYRRWIVEHRPSDAREIRFSRQIRPLVDEGRLLQALKWAMLEQSTSRFRFYLDRFGVAPNDSRALRDAIRELQQQKRMAAIWSLLTRQIAMSASVIETHEAARESIVPRTARQWDALLGRAEDELAEALGVECLAMLEIACGRCLDLRNLAAELKLDPAASKYFQRLARCVLFGFDIESCIICRALIDFEFGAIRHRGKQIDEYCKQRYNNRGKPIPSDFSLADRIHAARDPGSIIDEGTRQLALNVKRLGDKAVHEWSGRGEIPGMTPADVLQNVQTTVNVIRSLRAGVRA